MNAKTDTFLSLLLLALFIVFMTAVSMNEGMDFDSSYNMLSYQSLFNGQGFNYTYNGITVPFDPVISTGPEFYLPVFMLWKIIGEASYFSAIHFLIACYAFFFVFLICYVLKASKYKTLCIALFLCLFFSDNALFDENVFINPKGEPAAAFLMCAGCFLICEKRLNIIGFLLLGFAVDIKTNIVIGLVPSMGIFILLEHIWPCLKEKKYRNAGKNIAKFSLISLLIIAPHLVYTKLAPAIVLDSGEKQMLKQAQDARSGFMITRGFGHLFTLINQPDKEGAAKYVSKLKSKIKILKGYFADSFIITAVFILSLPFFVWLSYANKHFSLYMFLITIFICFWWIFAAGDPWYRYLSVADFMYFFGIVSLVPVLAPFRPRPAVMVYAVIILAIFLPRFSLGAISRHFDDTHRNNFLAMKDKISEIDENQIFTYGWFQAPQLMFLTGKRFQDYLDVDRFRQAKEKFGEVFFLATVENTVIKKDMNELRPSLELVTAHGYNKLYKFRDAVNHVEIEITDWGPSKIEHGKKFNTQPNGVSVMWITADNITPSCVIVWGKTLLDTAVYLDRSALTAFVPDSLYQKSGQYKLYVLDRRTNRKSNTILMDVLP